MAVTLNSNIAALGAQRRLAEHTTQLRRVSERLSSGLRINHAADDPASNSVSSLLNVDARVVNQGIRNANDGMSVLEIAEGAARELSSVLVRIGELSESAANGTLTSAQRTSLHAEATALRAEYNRIVDSVKFNGQTLLDGSLGTTNIQIGYGENGRIAIGLDLGLTEARGTGSYSLLGTSGSTTALHAVVATADFNYDGITDVLYGMTGFADEFVLLGNGDGTFRAPTSLNLTLNTNYDVGIGDVNNDGFIDITASDNLDGRLYVQLGSASGTFGALVSYAGVGDGDQTVLVDLNGDSFLDVASAGANLDIITVFLNTGLGTFKSPVSYVTGNQTAALPGDIASGDFNNDGIADLVTFAHGDNRYDVFFGVGNGTFQPRVSILTSTGGYVGLSTADVNRDGKDDIVSGLEVLLSNGNGTFSIPTVGAFAFSGNAGAPIIGDFNGDGIDDFLKPGTAAAYAFIGNGNGTFAYGASFATGPIGVNQLTAADVTGDGVLDALFAKNSTGVQAFAQSTSDALTAYLPEVNLNSRQAALETGEMIRTSIQGLGEALGAIGATASRITTATANAQTAVLEFRNAESVIRDADIAAEAANLVKTQILQQASAAVLAQANQLPQLALALLQT